MRSNVLVGDDCCIGAGRLRIIEAKDLAIVGLHRSTFDGYLDHWWIVNKGGGVTMGDIIRPSVPQDIIIYCIITSIITAS